MKTRRALVAVLFALAFPAVAHAHVVDLQFGDYYGGALHPLTALEHVLPMIALGILAGQQGPALARQLFVIFPAALALGAIAAIGAPASRIISVVNIASFLVLGVLVALARPLPPWGFRTAALLFGATHGYANVAALPAAISPGLFISGLVTSGVVVSSVVPAFVVGLRSAWTRVAVRVAGSWIAAIGLMMMAFLARPGK